MKFNYIDLKRFLDLSKEKSLSIYQDIVENSEVLRKIAEDTAKKEYYGAAVALQILSMEELIKALAVFFNGKGLNVFALKGTEKIFFNHKIKHEAILVIMILDLFEKYFEKNEQDLLYKIINGTIDLFFTAPNEFDWWENADRLKQEGLYVDYRNEIKRPGDIKKSTYYEVEKRYVKLKAQFIKIEKYLNSEKEKRIIKDFHLVLKDFTENSN